MRAFIEKENIKLGPKGTTPFVTEETLLGGRNNRRTFGKALGVAEQAAIMEEKVHHAIRSHQVYVHESKMTTPIPLLSTASGAPVATTEVAELFWNTADKLVMACRRGNL